MKKTLFSSLFVLFGTATFAQVGIGTVSPDPDAMLELSATDRGFLLPRIALTAANDPAPLDSHIEGMTIFNTATSGTAENRVTPGFYVNNGSGWLRTGLDSGLRARWVTKPGKIVLLNLSDGVTLRPDGTEFVALDNGNVGIGTTDPTDKLTIKASGINRGAVIDGPSYLEKTFTFANLTAGEGEINWKKTSGALAASIRSVGYGTTGSKGLMFYTGDASDLSGAAVEQMRVAADGKIGLRNPSRTSYTSPARLGIQANQRLTGLNVEGIKFSQISGNSGIITYENDFTIQSDSLMRISSNTGYLHLNAKNSAQGGIRMKTNDVLRMEILGTDADTTGYDGIAIYDKDANVTAKFTADGKVGFGTVSPNEKVEVSGAVKVGTNTTTTISHNATTPVPAGGAGTMVFTSGAFYGWNGNEWKKLNN